MSVEHIEELDTLNQGRLKINAILDQPSRLQEMQFQRQIIINKNLILCEMISIN